MAEAELPTEVDGNEWDFFAIGSDRLPEGDRLWMNPLPAPEGAW
ncbi:MAG: hypothetical protein R2883_01825 [Caldisericia bacterium]